MNPHSIQAVFLSSDGTPIAGAVLDVWSGDGEGTYDRQMEGDVGMKARGRIRTDAQGRYSFRSIKPEYYPVPVGRARGPHAAQNWVVIPCAPAIST